MNALSVASILLFLLLGVIALSLLYISKIFKKYDQITSEMKKDGSYSEWAKENKTLLFFAKIFNYTAALCLAGFIIIAIYKWLDYPIIFIQLFFTLKLISILFYLILYLRIPQTKQDVI